MTSFVVILTLALPASAAAADPATRVIELTNAERARHGLGPLQANPQLTQAAQSYAQVMASTDCFAHTCGPTPNFVDRVTQAGYTGWSELHENIAAGYQTPEDVVAGWLASPGHRAAMLDPDINEIGVGVATGGRFGIVWVQEMGARPVQTPQPTPQPAPQPTPQETPQQTPQETPRFNGGFRDLASLIPDLVGDPITGETHNPVNGDTIQQTTRGLLVWRNADNWTAFTDGVKTWVKGPDGLKVRLNDQRFPWEAR